MASVRLIAQRAGVSITTVSRVLNNHPQVSSDVRQRVLSASNEAGYTPSIGRKSTCNIALVYTGASSLGSPFDAGILEGLSCGLEEHEFDLMILDVRRARLPNETYTQMFMRKGVRGAILRSTTSSRAICQAIAAEGFPCVVVGDRFDEPNISYVYSDSRDASTDAVEHLISLGHRRIALGVNVVEDSDHADRLMGYRQALAENDIPFDEKLVLYAPANRDGGAQLLRRMLTLANRPTAAFLTDPMTALGAISEARKTKVNIPGELSIVGFDDTDLRYGLSPELSAVCQDAVGLGREALSALTTILLDPVNKPVIRRAMRTWLEVHESTGPMTAE